MISCSYGLKVTDGMYFVQGFLYDVLSGIAIALNPSTDRLGPELPPHRYFTLDLMSVLIPQSLCFVGFQVLALYILSQQDFYVKYATDEPLTSGYAYETTVLGKHTTYDRAPPL
jgi:hypothetical protein